MVRFEDGPLRGVTLPVDHTAEEYRHTVREPVNDDRPGLSGSVLRADHPRRRDLHEAGIPRRHRRR
jgi:hypothetical protein